MILVKKKVFCKKIVKVKYKKSLISDVYGLKKEASVKILYFENILKGIFI